MTAIADGDDRTRVIDVLPRQLADVDETVHAAEVDERTEADTTLRHDTLADLAGLEVGEEAVADSFCVSSRKARRLSTTLLRFLSSSMILACTILPTYGARSRTRRSSTSDAGQEATQADVDDEAALDDLDHRTLDHAVGFLDLLDRAPRPLVLRPLLGEQQAAFLVFLLEDERFDLLAELDDLVRVDVVADAQLAGGDDTLALVADVEQHFVLVDLDDGADDQLAVLDFDERAVDGIGEGHAKVVGDDLAGGVIALLRRRCPWHRWLTEKVVVSDKGQSLSNRDCKNGPADSGPSEDTSAHCALRQPSDGRSPGIQATR